MENKIFKLPDDQANYTVEEMVMQAKKIYHINFQRTNEDGKKVYNAIRRKIERTIAEEQYTPISDSDTIRNKRYSHEDVFDILFYKLRYYLAKKSQECLLQNKKLTEKEIKEQTEYLDEIINDEETLRAQREQYTEKYDEYQELLERYVEASQYENSTPIEERKNKFLHEFLSDYIFESFFDALFSFDKEAFDHDLERYYSPESLDRNPPDEVKDAIIRMRRQKYIQPRFDLTAFFKTILQNEILKSDNEKNGVFKKN